MDQENQNGREVRILSKRNLAGERLVDRETRRAAGTEGSAEARSAPRSKRWLCTLNNPGDRIPIWNADEMDYMVWQTEIGAKKHTVHWHCYVRFKNRKTRAGCAKCFPGMKPDMRVARGTEKECHDYCTKAETRVAPGFEFGEYLPATGTSGQGERTDLMVVANKCKMGATLKDIAADHPETFVKYHSGLAALHALVAPLPPAMREVKVAVLWGPTGTGKSYRVATQMPDAYKVRPGRDPWGNYRGEDVIWFDEFDYTKWSLFEMNEYMDVYRCKLDRRYTDAYAAWTRVVICANSNPTSWYPGASALEVAAFRRRLGSGCRLVEDRYTDVFGPDALPNPNFGPDPDETQMQIQINAD